MVGLVGEFETVLTISGESDVAIGSHGSRWMGATIDHLQAATGGQQGFRTASLGARTSGNR